jgi:blue copper oxidase
MTPPSMVPRFSLLLLIAGVGTACSAASDSDTGDLTSAVRSGAYSSALPIPPLMEATDTTGGATKYILEAKQGGLHYFDATRKSETFSYNGGIPASVLDNGGNVVKTATTNGSTLGPTFRVRKGEKLDVEFRANIDKTTSLHWHGLKANADADVMPVEGIASGMSYRTSFPIQQEAATLWYHPHQHMDVGRQVYTGLAGMFIVDDENSDALAAAGLPHEYGVDDIPVILQDLRFDTKNGHLKYVQDDQDQDGMLGDQISLNGVLRPIFTAKKALTRFRFLNASTSRPYKIAFSNKQKFWQIASDGGFLNAPVERTALSVAPSERVEIVVDFTKAKTGMIELVSFAFKPLDRDDAMEVQEGSESSLDWREGAKTRSRASKEDLQNVKDGRPPSGYGFALAQIRIPTDVQKQSVPALPPVLNHVPDADPSVAANLDHPRTFQLEGPATDDKVHNPEGFDYAATINKVKLDPEMKVVNEHVKQNSFEVWDVTNAADDMMHPFHVHGGSFRVISRTTGPVSAGDLGLKDTVQTFPGETVRILVDWSIGKGNYFYHCHVLEHEDMGMMGIVAVE